MMRERPFGVAPGGRFVIPAAARAAMEIGEDGTVTVYLHEGELRILSPRAAIKRAQAFVQQHDKGGGSITDELLPNAGHRRSVANRACQGLFWIARRFSHCCGTRRVPNPRDQLILPITGVMVDYHAIAPQTYHALCDRPDSA